MFKFEINGSPYYIPETLAGYRWMPPHGSGRLFPTLLEAQQDAIDVRLKHIREEDKEMSWDDYWDNRRNDNDE